MFLVRVQRYRERKHAKKIAALKRRSQRELSKRHSTLSPPKSSNSSKMTPVTHAEICTPICYKAQIRQRTYDCRIRLPKSPTLKTAVVNRLVKDLLMNPQTEKKMSACLSSLARYSKPIPVDKELHRDLMKLKKYRTKKKLSEVSALAAKIKSNYSIRAAARELNIEYSVFYNLMHFKSKSDRQVTELQMRRVKQFYARNHISMRLPYKKYAKNMYLRDTLSVAYEAYMKEQIALGCRVLSKSAVYRILKKSVRTRNKVPFKDCQCDICLNFMFLVDALLAYRVKGISRRMTENVTQSFCDLIKDPCTKDARRRLDMEDAPTISEFPRKCIFRLCNNCGKQKLQQKIVDENVGIDWSSKVVWHQWEVVKEEGERNRVDKIRYTGDLATLLAVFCVAVQHLSTHLFHFRWQAYQFEVAKTQLQAGDVLMVMDFAANFIHRRQFEVQKAFFTRISSTVHPIVTYYPCPKTPEDLVCDEIVIISNDLTHDSHAVRAFVQRAVQHLKEQNVPVQRIIQFSDNCSVQYKCYRVFDDISKIEIPVSRNYFGQQHGKAEADGCIGRTAMHVNNIIRSGKTEVGDSFELTRLCVRDLNKSGHSELCAHSQRHYFHVTNIDRENPSEADTLEGTQQFHSVRNTGTNGVIEVRESSCFCDVCFLNATGKCPNEHLVKDFTWANLYKSRLVPEKDMLNTLWTSKTVPYVKEKRTFVRKIQRKRKTRVTEQASVPIKKEGDVSVDIVDEGSSSDSDYEYTIPLRDIQKALREIDEQKFPLRPVRKCRIPQKASTYRREAKTVTFLEDYEQEQSCDSIDDIQPLSSIQLQSPARPSVTQKNATKLVNSSNTWENIYNQIQKPTTFVELKSVISSLALPKLPNSYIGDKCQVGGDVEDKDSKQYIPPDLPSIYQLHRPMVIYGDGNCFPRSISRIVYGTVDFYTEIRCRIIIDLVQNFNQYIDHNYLMRGAPPQCHTKQYCHIGTLYSLLSPTCKNTQLTSVTEIADTLMHEILHVRKNGESCGIWEIHAAANIMGCKLFVAFPDQRTRDDVREAMNRIFWPSGFIGNCSINTYPLMWSKTDKSLTLYNHFVPLIQW